MFFYNITKNENNKKEKNDKNFRKSKKNYKKVLTIENECDIIHLVG